MAWGLTGGQETTSRSLASQLRVPLPAAQPALGRSGAERRLSSKEWVHGLSLAGGHLVMLWHVVGHSVRDHLPLSLWLPPSQDPSWNHRVYRLALTKLSPPLIPFMPLLLKGKGTSLCRPAPTPPVPAAECPPDPLDDSTVPTPWGHKG